MATSTYTVCEYLSNKILSLDKSSAEFNHIQDLLQDAKDVYSTVNEHYKNKFVGVDLDNYGEFIVGSHLPMNLNISEGRLLLDARIIQKLPNSELPQVKDAYDEIRQFLNVTRELIKRFRTELDQLQHNEEKEKLTKILKIFKSGEGAAIKLSGNINREDYQYILELLSDSGLPLEVINDFLGDLNEAIAIYKFKQNKINAAIEKEARKEELKNLAKQSLHDLNPEDTARLLKGEEPRKAPEYNYKRINRLIEKIKVFYDGKLENPPITKDTPFDKNRVRLYYVKDKNGIPQLDMNIILFDLINFINPDDIEEKFKKGEIKPNELDYIRGKLYKEIIKICKPAIPDEVFEEEPVAPTVEQIVESLTSEVKEEKKSKEGYKNPNVKPLSEEIQAKIEYAKKVVRELTYQFADMLKFPIGLLEQCYHNGNTEGYNFDMEMLSLQFDYIPRFNDSYKQYKVTYEELLNNPEFADEGFMECLEGDQDELISATDRLISRFEIYNSDKDEEVIDEYSPEPNNIVMLYSQYTNGSTPIPDDVEYMKKKFHVDENQVYDGIGRLSFITTIVNGPNVKKISGSKHDLEDLRVYRYRQGDLRYVYLNINIDDDNKEILKEKYGLKTDNLRLLLVPCIFFKKGNDKIYDVALSRVESIKGIDENQVDSIKWIKNIFGNKFTKETQEIAFNLIENGIAIRESIKKDGGVELGNN